MGLEAVCGARLDGASIGEGKAHCGDLELEFKGDKRVKFYWKDLASVSAENGVLRTESQGSLLELDLGDKAEKWAHAILNPKSLIDKFGLKDSHSYRVVGEMPQALAADIVRRAGEPGSAPFDAVFVRMDSLDDLSRLGEIKPSIKQDAMVWVVYPKGQKHFRESDVRGYALENGWVDIKIASVDDVQTSVKLVIPKHLRH